jgi:RNA polymerase sigma-70 factor (ECF subfamily)
MLAPDVVVHGDGGGKAQAIAKPVAGRQRVIPMVLALFRRVRAIGVTIRLAWVNGQPGAVMYDAEGRVLSVLELDVADGVVQAIRGVVNPDKLGHLGPVSDMARLPEEE